MTDQTTPQRTPMTAEQGTPPRPSGCRKWFMGCGCGCLVMILLVIVLGVFGYKQYKDYLFDGLQDVEFTTKGGETLHITEPVDEPTFFFAGEVTIDAPCNDHAVFFAGDVIINSTMAGKVNVCAGNLTIGENAHLTNGLNIRSAGNVIIKGRVDGDITGHYGNMDNQTSPATTPASAPAPSPHTDDNDKTTTQPADS